MLKFFGFLLICCCIGIGLNVANHHYRWPSMQNVIYCGSKPNSFEATVGITTCQMPITIHDMVFVGLCVVAGYFWWKN